MVPTLRSYPASIDGTLYRGVHLATPYSTQRVGACFWLLDLTQSTARKFDASNSYRLCLTSFGPFERG
jgi:hypothetical protein